MGPTPSEASPLLLLLLLLLLFKEGRGSGGVQARISPVKGCCCCYWGCFSSICFCPCPCPPLGETAEALLVHSFKGGWGEGRRVADENQEGGL